jgi:hypothetical protein
VRADAGIAARFREHCERLLLQHAESTISIEDTVAEIDRKVAALRRRVTILSTEVGGTEDGDKVVVDLVKSINGLLKEKATLLQKKDQTALVRGPEEVEEFFNLLSNKGSANKPLTEEEKATLREFWPIATTFAERRRKVRDHSSIR